MHKTFTRTIKLGYLSESGIQRELAKAWDELDQESNAWLDEQKSQSGRTPTYETRFDMRTWKSKMGDEYLTITLEVKIVTSAAAVTLLHGGDPA